uniref:hypothetical protein n=1 Tax=Gorillibacterium massiliense TaxID=1280390 RepID=UPI0005930BA0
MKDKNGASKSYEIILWNALRAGSVAVPQLFLVRYKKLGLSELEAMLIIQLMEFVERERVDFPTHEEIQSRMAAAPSDVIAALQRLVHQGFINIDSGINPETGLHCERYNLDGLYGKLAAALVDEEEKRQEAERQERERGAERNMFVIFEKEFSRPL